MAEDKNFYDQCNAKGINLWVIFGVLIPFPSTETVEEYIARCDGTRLCDEQLTLIYADAAISHHEKKIEEWKELRHQYDVRLERKHG